MTANKTPDLLQIVLACLNVRFELSHVLWFRKFVPSDHPVNSYRLTQLTCKTSGTANPVPSLVSSSMATVH